MSMILKRFSIKNLDDLHYFLVVEILPTSTGFLTFSDIYIHDLLTRTNLGCAKKATTPKSMTLSIYDKWGPTNSKHVYYLWSKIFVSYSSSHFISCKLTCSVYASTYRDLLVSCWMSASVPQTLNISWVLP